MKARQNKDQGIDSNPRRGRGSKRARAGAEEVMALAGDYLLAVTSGASPRDETGLAEIPGFHFFGLS